MLFHTEEGKTYLDNLYFSDEATFQVCGTVNRHVYHIWVSENSHDVTEYECDSPKVTVWCTL
jgi:hypothetical protein